MKRITIFIVGLFTALAAQSQEKQLSETILNGERWWAIGNKPVMLNHTNAPDGKFSLLVSSAGRYVWSKNHFTAECNDGKLILGSTENLKTINAGKTLKEAYVTAHYKHINAKVQVSKEIFERPFYVMSVKDSENFTQEDIIKRAEWLISKGFPNGTIIIDDRWQEFYGSFSFDTQRFPDPGAMVKSLKEKGFDIKLSIVPYITPDSRLIRREKLNNSIATDPNGNPKIIRWNRGWSGCFDLNNESVQTRINAALDKIKSEYKIDGFRFECIDSEFPELAESWAKIASMSKGNIANQIHNSTESIFEICYDDTDIENIKDFVSRVLSFGFSGKHHFIITPTHNSKSNILNQIRLQTLMPTMQLIVENLEELSAADLTTALELVRYHHSNIPYFESILTAYSQKGDPFIRPLEYEFPRKGFCDCIDQFMIGDKIIIAPLSSDNRSRTVRLPKGVWFDCNNKKIKGPVVLNINFDNNPLPYFRRK